MRRGWTRRQGKATNGAVEMYNFGIGLAWHDMGIAF